MFTNSVVTFAYAHCTGWQTMAGCNTRAVMNIQLSLYTNSLAQGIGTK